jgi:hypothetical protein
MNEFKSSSSFQTIFAIAYNSTPPIFPTAFWNSLQQTNIVKVVLAQQKCGECLTCHPVGKPMHF